MCVLQELISGGTRVRYEHVREEMTVMYQVISGMLEIAHHMENRSDGLSTDMKKFAHNLRLVSPL